MNSLKEKLERANPMKGWHDDAPHTKEEREHLYYRTKVPGSCFFEPNHQEPALSKFPFCAANGSVDPRGVLSAEARAKILDARGYHYEDVVKKAAMVLGHMKDYAEKMADDKMESRRGYWDDDKLRSRRASKKGSKKKKAASQKKKKPASQKKKKPAASKKKKASSKKQHRRQPSRKAASAAKKRMAMMV